MKDYISVDIDNIKDANECLEELFEKGDVNKSEKEKLFDEISKSGLPKISEEDSEILN